MQDKSPLNEKMQGYLDSQDYPDKPGKNTASFSHFMGRLAEGDPLGAMDFAMASSAKIGKEDRLDIAEEILCNDHEPNRQWLALLEALHARGVDLARDWAGRSLGSPGTRRPQARPWFMAAALSLSKKPLWDHDGVHLFSIICARPESRNEEGAREAMQVIARIDATQNPGAWTTKSTHYFVTRMHDIFCLRYFTDDKKRISGFLAAINTMKKAKVPKNLMEDELLGLSFGNLAIAKTLCKTWPWRGNAAAQRRLLDSSLPNLHGNRARNSEEARAQVDIVRELARGVGLDLAQHLAQWEERTGHEEAKKIINHLSPYYLIALMDEGLRVSPELVKISSRHPKMPGDKNEKALYAEALLRSHAQGLDRQKAKI